MQILMFIGLGLFVSFVGIILFGAPFLPTKRRQIEVALNILDMQPGQLLLELGAGDGRVALAAAKRGLKVEAFELNPFLALICRIKTLKYKNQVKVHLKNYWYADLSKADALFIFSGEIFMNRLASKLMQVNQPLKVVSFAFEIPGVTHIKQQEAIFLYEYPLAKQCRHR